MLKGNRGEWSEVYTFLRLLSEGKAYSADANLKLLEGCPYIPVVRVLRQEKGQPEISYYIKDLVEIKTDMPNIPNEISREEIGIVADNLYQQIATFKSGKGSFAVPEVEGFMNNIGVNSLKAPSHDKSDITLEIRDQHTGTTSICGWSIKSELGSSPTLLNASKSTNFIFKLNGCSSTLCDKVNSINTTSKIKDRLSQLSKSCRFVYSSMSNDIFKRNLQLIDSVFPEILAQALLLYYQGKGPGCKVIVSKLEKEDPLNLGPGMYEFKFKKFLCAVALGMVPSTAWNGRDDASGGYIVVRPDGKVVVFHIYNRDMFEDYLLANTKFETPSTSRHDFGSVYEADGNFYLNLNLQIRFK